MNCKKKRGKGVRVKKYQHGGYHGDPPYTASADGTYVAMPDLSFLPVLQPVLRQTPPNEGEIRPMPEGADRAAPLATMLSDPMGTLRAIREQQRLPTPAELDIASQKTGAIGDVMRLSYPALMAEAIEQGSPAAALVPHSTPFNTAQASSQGVLATPRTAAPQGFVQARSPAFGLVPTDVYRVGQDAVVDHIAMRQAMFETPEMQSRAAQRIADNLTSVYNALKDDIANAGLGPVQMQEWNRLSGAVVNGKVDPSSPLVRTLLNRNTQNVRNLKVDVDNLVSNKPTGMSAEEIYEVERNVRSLEKEIRELDEQIVNAASREEKIALDAAQQEIKNQLISLEQSILGKSVQSPRTAEMSMGGGRPLIRVKGEFLDSPRRARDVAEHEFQHVTQEIPYEDLFPNLSATPAYRSKFRTTLPEYDVLEQQMLDELTMRKVSVPKTNTPRDKRMWDEAKEYFINPRDQAYPSTRERMPFLGEAKQQLVETGVIPSLESTVTKQDVLNFYDDLYAPEKLRRMGDQPIMDHPESLRFFELFDPRVGNNAEKIAEFMNRLSAIAIGAGAAGAAIEEYKYGGKIKVKKKKKPGYRTV